MVAGVEHEKCNAMHVGHIIPTRYYTNDGENNQELTTVTETKDLEIFTTNDLKPSRQCAAASAKASAVLGLIKGISGR